MLAYLARVESMPIEDLPLSPILGGLFSGDRAAIRAGARRDGEFDHDAPATRGFPAVRVPARLERHAR